MAFRGLQSESIAEGQAHKHVSQELKTLVAGPFDEWSKAYKVNISCANLVQTNKCITGEAQAA
jgi:hypothetical protein